MLPSETFSANISNGTTDHISIEKETLQELILKNQGDKWGKSTEFRTLIT